jgi:hypothetical protein
MPFQTSVNTNLPIGVEGDPYGTNPSASVPSQAGAFVAGPNGVTVGQFAWIQTDGITVANSPQTGTPKPDGFVPREQQGLITNYLAESSMVIPEGFGVSIMGSGSWLDKVTVAPALLRQKAFAKLTDGTLQPGAAGATISGYVETDFSIMRAAAVGDLTVINLY